MTSHPRVLWNRAFSSVRGAVGPSRVVAEQGRGSRTSDAVRRSSFVSSGSHVAAAIRPSRNSSLPSGPSSSCSSSAVSTIKLLLASPMIDGHGNFETPTAPNTGAHHDGNKVIRRDETRYELSKHYRKCLCWSKRTIIERSLVVIAALLFVVCLALLLLNILLQARLKEASSKDTLCITKECIAAAASLLSKLDTTMSPCQDFYQFACGNYIEKNTVPDDHYHRSLIQTMQDDIYVTLNKLLEQPIKPNDSEAILKVKKLYSSCMNTSSVEDGSVAILLNLLSESGVGEWPVLQKSWDRKRVDLERMLAILHVYEVQPFFHTFVAPDDRNTSVYLLHLYSGSPVLNTQYYLNATEGEHELYLAAYRELILETLRLLGAEQKTAFTDVDAMLEFEKAFANLTQESYESLNSQTGAMNNSSENGTAEEEFHFNRLNISQLEEIVPELKWSQLVKYVFDQVGINGGPTVDPNDLNVVVHCETYLQHLMTLINVTAPRTVANYLAWRFVIKYMPYLDIHFRRLYYDFRRQVPNLSDERTFFARWKECVHVVNDGFGMALAALFVNHQYDKDSEKEVREMVRTLKQSFTRILPSQTWLDQSTKNLCKEKVEAMSEKIGYPQYILDPEQLDKDYVGLDISDDHFLNNILGMNRFEVLKELMKITRPVDKEKDWFVEPLVVNAFYEATGNTVIFPAGILRSPVFHPSRPKFLNYGTLGVVIGHEITHGFDNNGRRFDKGGNLTQWWPDDVSERFKEIAACFSDQYSQYPIEYVGQNVNGNQTLDENICDNAGLQQAYEAYKKYVDENGEEASLPGVDFSNEQIFFLRYAQIWCEVVGREGHEKYLRDNHAPGKYRANGALMNSPQFSTTFNCREGSPMNPSKKCKLWG